MNFLRSSRTARCCLLLAALVLAARATAEDSAIVELPAPRRVVDAPAREPEAVKPRQDDAKAADAKPKGDAKAEKKQEPAPADGKCDRCGSCACVRRVCTPKRTEKEVTKVCWSYKCEEFCIPGPSIYCGEKCGRDACGCWKHSLWEPTCAEVRTKRVPVKNEVKRKVPTVQWKVEERCAACRVLCFGVPQPEGRDDAAK